MRTRGETAAQLDPQLASLARRLGIERHYWDLLGQQHATSVETARALCRAMGFEADSEARAAESVSRFENEQRANLIAPVQVFRQHSSCPPKLLVRHPGGAGFRVQLQVCNEQNARCVREQELPGAPDGAWVALPLPGELDSGLHRIELRLSRGTHEQLAKQRLLVAPRTALRVSEKLAEHRVAGLWTNLYSVRGERSWGFGDSGDLLALARACGAAGGDFLGVNPLHAVPFATGGVSPYSPLSRFFRNPLYIDVEAVPHFDGCAAARRLVEKRSARAAQTALRNADALDCAAVWSQKEPPLRALHDAFGREAGPERRARYEAYRDNGGAALLDFATFVVLSLQGPARGAPWQEWPAALRDPQTAEVAEFRARYSDEVDFQLWLQFELDEQLAGVAQSCQESGQAIGLYFDLAVGSAEDSADTWALAHCHAIGVSIGAPPDAYAPEGQVWGLPPLDPNALGREGYESWQRLLRASFRHAGALRIDHVMGLQRQFWIPDGGTAQDGAYVRFPVDDLLGILALESRRNAALVIGEDLGTVPPELPNTLASWGILSSSVFVFERDPMGAFPAPAQLSSRALATIGTHDLPPLAGYAAGRDLELRRLAGAIESEDDLREAKTQRRNEVAALLTRLRTEGLVGDEASPEELRRGLAALLGASPAPLVGVSLDDVAGESEPINLPGIPVELHPSWTRRMSSPLSELLAHQHLCQELPRSRSHPRPGPMGSLPAGPKGAGPRKKREGADAEGRG